MELNQALLDRLMEDVESHFGAYLKRILTASADYGTFGLPLLDALHGELPPTTCSNCGTCCNSISIFSIEYHRIIRDLMERLPPDRIRLILARALRLDQRLAEVGEENRLRCAFRDDDTQICLVHPVRPFACRFFGLLKADGQRECQKVLGLAATPPLSDERIEELTAKIMDISESFTLAPGKPPVAFFPIEFWLFRFALGEQKALEIYREILVPASTPLTHFWQEHCN